MNSPNNSAAPDNVVPFEPRSVRGDWTGGELERLEELSRKLEAQGARVGTAYGVSDEGDPWCVITNDADEVLIHVARIGGRFVIHDAAADALQDGDTLWSAFDRLLGAVWREGREDGVVIPLHQAQVLLAVVAALAFERENAVTPVDRPPAPHASHEAPTHQIASLAAALSSTIVDDAPHTAVVTPPRSFEDPSVRRSALAAPDPERLGVEPATATATPLPSTPRSDAAPIHTAAVDPGQIDPVQRFETLVAGQSAGQVLIGGPGGDHLVGGAGGDTLSGGGAGPGQLDVLEGGPGADRLVVADHTVAIGGPGPDVFVVNPPPKPDAPPHVTGPPASTGPGVSGPAAGTPATGAPAIGTPTTGTPASGTPAAGTPDSAGPASGTPASGTPAHPGPTPSGVILDFSADDRLDFGSGGPAKVISVTEVADVLAGLHTFTGLDHAGATPGVEVGFDLDGDGTTDIYVLIAGPATSSLIVGATFGEAVRPTAAHDHVTDTVILTHPSPNGEFLFG